jgi:hypothetical protein
MPKGTTKQRKVSGKQTSIGHFYRPPPIDYKMFEFRIGQVVVRPYSLRTKKKSPKNIQFPYPAVVKAYNEANDTRKNTIEIHYCGDTQGDPVPPSQLTVFDPQLAENVKKSAKFQLLAKSKQALVLDAYEDAGLQHRKYMRGVNKKQVLRAGNAISFWNPADSKKLFEHSIVVEIFTPGTVGKSPTSAVIETDRQFQLGPEVHVELVDPKPDNPMFDGKMCRLRDFDLVPGVARNAITMSDVAAAGMNEIKNQLRRDKHFGHLVGASAPVRNTSDRHGHHDVSDSDNDSSDFFMSQDTPGSARKRKNHKKTSDSYASSRKRTKLKSSKKNGGGSDEDSPFEYQLSDDDERKESMRKLMQKSKHNIAEVKNELAELEAQLEARTSSDNPIKDVSQPDLNELLAAAGADTSDDEMLSPSKPRRTKRRTRTNRTKRKWAHSQEDILGANSDSDDNAVHRHTGKLMDSNDLSQLLADLKPTPTAQVLHSDSEDCDTAMSDTGTKKKKSKQETSTGGASKYDDADMADSESDDFEVNTGRWSTPKSKSKSKSKSTSKSKSKSKSKATPKVTPKAKTKAKATAKTTTKTKANRRATSQNTPLKAPRSRSHNVDDTSNSESDDDDTLTPLPGKRSAARRSPRTPNSSGRSSAKSKSRSGTRARLVSTPPSKQRGGTKASLRRSPRAKRLLQPTVKSKRDVLMECNDSDDSVSGSESEESDYTGIAHIQKSKLRQSPGRVEVLDDAAGVK